MSEKVFIKYCSFSGIGKRQNNEDSVFPLPNEKIENNRLFIVCDGVGGEDKGEIASTILVNEIRKYFELKSEMNVDKTFIEDSVRSAEAILSDHKALNKDCEAMASTLTLLYLFDDRAIIGWAGDSRIYHLRKGNILYKTKDHSLVNWLYEQGEITEDEMSTHPKKNQILRAVNGKESPVQIDIVEINDIKPGDMIFLCTDGVLESVSDKDMSAINKKFSNPEMIADVITERCRVSSKDNYTGCLIIFNNKDKLPLGKKIFGGLFRN